MVVFYVNLVCFLFLSIDGVGGYLVAMAAKHYHVPVIILAGQYKVFFKVVSS